MMPQENSGWVVTHYPASKTFLGVNRWAVTTSPVDVWQSVPLKTGEDYGNVTIGIKVRWITYIWLRE